MRTIHDYMMLARQRHGYTSRRQLSNALGLNATTVFLWDRQRTWPNNDDMISLADSAGVDRLEALNDRDRWRAAGQAKTCYQKIGDILAKGVSTALVLLAITGTAWGGTGRAQGNVEAVALDIMANHGIRFWFRWLARFVGVKKHAVVA